MHTNFRTVIIRDVVLHYQIHNGKIVVGMEKPSSLTNPFEADDKKVVLRSQSLPPVT